MAKRGTGRFLGWMAAAWAAILFLSTGFRVLADCASFGLPFTDLGPTGPGFCAIIAEAYWTGLTNGTTATTYSPSKNVTRAQMAAFITRTLDKGLQRGSRRAALDQWWTSTPHYDQNLGLVSVGSTPELLKSDGTDVWVANNGGTVTRVQSSSGKVLGTWTGAGGAAGILIAMGKVFVTGRTVPGKLYQIDPTAAPGAVTTLVSNLPNVPFGIAFDGNRIWTANLSGSVSIITPGTWSVATATTGFSEPAGLVFDGTHMWVTDNVNSQIDKLNSDGSIADTTSVGHNPAFPAFDGANIWVPNSNDSSLTIVRASDGTVLETFSAAKGNQNGLNAPVAAAFDGQRILVTNNGGGLSLFQATSLSPLGAIATPSVLPYGVCSDGINFWVSFSGSDKIGVF